MNAYRLQDQIESVEPLAEKCKTAEAQDAYDQLATVYAREFLDVPDDAARSAGRAHMDALFKQDIIENDPYNDSTTNVIQDDRWRNTPQPWNVQESLETLCDAVNMDYQFATEMTDFLRLHGQNVDGWEEKALNAYKIKTQHLTGDKQQSERLASYFVQGVNHHDEREWDKAQQAATLFYDTLFASRSRY